MILSNINNVHFRLGYYNNKTPIDLNYVVNMNNNVDNEITQNNNVEIWRIWDFGNLEDLGFMERVKFCLIRIQ